LQQPSIVLLINITLLVCASTVGSALACIKEGVCGPISNQPGLGSELSFAGHAYDAGVTISPFRSSSSCLHMYGTILLEKSLIACMLCCTGLCAWNIAKLS